MTTMQTQTPEQAVRALAEFFDGDESQREVLAEDFISFGPGIAPEGIQGRDAYIAFIRSYGAAFPDMTHRIDHLAVEGAVVLVEWTVKGTHKAPLGELPATGKKFTMRTASAYVVKDGKVLEERQYYNAPDLMAQLAVE